MLELVKRTYRVLYQVKESDKPVSCTIKTTDLLELHRVLVQMINYEMPTADWYDLVVHDVTGIDTKEYTQMYIAALYDDNYNFRSSKEVISNHPDMLESTPLFNTKKTPVKLSWSTIKDSVCFAPWMQFKEA